MAVLVTPAYPTEDANGVAFTGNPANRDDRSFLVNVQVGDTEVVSPPPGVESEKDLLVMDGSRVGRILRARESSLVVPGQRVLADEQLQELGEVQALVAAEFPKGLDLEGHPPGDVLVDVEFKFQDGQLILKQARPFLIRDATPPGPVHRLIVPPGTVVCGLWEEFRGGLQGEPPEERKAHAEYLLKSKIELRAGELALPVRAGTVLAPLVVRLEFGPEAAELEPLNSGIFGYDAAYSRWTFDQDFAAGDGRILRLTSELPVSDQVPVRVLDEEMLTLQRFLTGVLLLPDGSSGDTVRYGSCTHSTLPLWEVAAEFEGGDQALF